MLTPDQLRAVEFNTDENRLILGGPGSGKTQVLLHRADHLRTQHSVPPERFRVFIYTTALKQYVASAMALLGLPEASLLTFDAWCVQYYKDRIDRKLPKAKASAGGGRSHPDYPVIRHGVLEHVRLEGETLYDFVLVDEGQDLDRASIEIIARVSRHVTVCVDHKQQIYQQGCAEQEILSLLGIRKKNVTLLDAFRCSPYIARLASELIENLSERERFLRQTRTVETERQKPLIYFSDSYEGEKRRLVEAVRTRVHLGDRTAVLLPTNRMVYGYAKAFAEAGLEVETPPTWQTGYLPYDFSSDRPKLVTYHSVKGLTFDSVFMPLLKSRHFNGNHDLAPERLLFVGITRATKWCYLSGPSEDALPFLRQLSERLSGDHVSVQEGGAEHAAPVAQQRQEQVSDDLSDLL